MQQKSVMNHTFSDVPHVDIQRSTFNRSHSHKTTFDSDYLVPILSDELLPSSTHQINGTVFCRLNSPLLKPIMDNCYAEIHAFVVPFRILWSNWQKFMGERTPNPTSSIDYTLPVLTTGTPTSGSLSDYFGIPVGVSVSNSTSLYHRAYYRIWNEWYRDQNLQDSDSDGLSVLDGPNNIINKSLKKRGKRHDYFTSAVPYPQRLNADDAIITLPLGDRALVYTDSSPLISGSQSPLKWYQNNGTPTSDLSLGIQSGDARPLNNATGGFTGLSVYPNNLYANLADATAASVNSVRQAFQLQRMLEKDMRAGTRYCEILQGHFMVTDPMSNVLQRPEYIGGTKARLEMATVPQTSEGTTTKQANLSAYGTIVAEFDLTKSITEHSILMILLSVQADLTYQRGLARKFSRRTREDFYWPSLANLGERAILNKEIYYQGNANDELVFGYQEIWSEYRYFPSQITGQLRSTHATSLDVYHLSEDFAALPTLSDSFIQSSTGTALDRCIAVPSEPQWIMDAYFDIKSTLPMPTYSVPGMIDHF